MNKTDNAFMSIQPGGEVDSNLFLIGNGMGFYDIEYVNKIDNKFLFLASDGLGQSLDNGYFSMASELAPIKKQLFVPHLYDNRNLALANPITAYTSASEYNAIAMASVRTQKKR